VTRLVAVLGVLCLVGFCVAWPPAVLLVAGVALLSVAWVRSVNERGRRGAA
jgi:hypothetical protein